MYQVVVLLTESRNGARTGPYSFATPQEREDFVRGPQVYWYHFAEEDDWHSWRRGGAWNATAVPGPAERVNIPPEVTEEDRW